MEERKIAESVERGSYFKSVDVNPATEQNRTMREMGELHPFIISGGMNTERYYFTHINNKTDHKFNVRPKYFGDESNYTEAFPKRIRDILSTNNEAKIFCVFDWDTIYGDKKKLNKHSTFEAQFEKEISDGTVTLCPSMPCIEYWFLLHYVNYTKLLKNYGEVSGVLASHMKPCFPYPTKPLKKLLKQNKFLQDSSWVENLCADGKLNTAIERAEKNIKAAIASDDIDNQSYSYIFKVFKK